MALSSYPFENTNTTEDQYTLLFRNFVDSGIVGDYGDSQYAVTTDGSGLDVQVAAGYAILRGHAVNNDGPVTVTLDAADTANPRIDTIVLRLDPVANGINLVVLKGNPSATPTSPAYARTSTGLWDLPLASIQVAANALNVVTENITDQRTWSSHRFGVWRNADRPSDPAIGQPGFNIDINGAEVWSGTKWESVSAKKKIVVPHTFTLAGPIVTANLIGDYYVPPFFVPVPTGQTARVVGARSQIWHGGGGQVNSVSWAVTALKAETSRNVISTQTTTHHLGMASVNLATPTVITADDALGLVVSGVTGTPKNLSVTVFIEYEA